MNKIIEQQDLFADMVTIFYCKNEMEQIKLGTIEATKSDGYKANRTIDNKIFYSIDRGKCMNFVLSSSAIRTKITQINLF